MSATNRLQQKLKSILQELAASLVADVATLFLYDASADTFEFPVGYGLIDGATFTDVHMRPRVDRVAGRIVKEKRGIVANQVALHPTMDGPFARRERIVSAAGFPILSRGNKAIGVLFVSYRRGHSFAEKDLQVIKTTARRAATTIIKANIFTILRQNRLTVQQEETEMKPTLQAIASLACNVMNLPTSIWLLDTRTQSLRIEAATGLTHSYVNEASATIGDGSLISQVVQKEKALVIRHIHKDNRFHYPRHAKKAGWVSTIGFPIKFRGQIRGVIEVVTFEPRDFGQVELDTLQRLSELASVTIENSQHSLEAKKLAHIAHTLSAAPDFGRAMQVIVESARELTGADSSTIFLYEKEANRFTIGRRSPTHSAPPRNVPRSEGGLTRHIIDTGESVHIGDIARDKRVRKEVVHEGTLSLIGVRLQMANEQIGVLYVNGPHKNQFTKHDASLLQTLADQASAALGWARVLLRPSDEIEKAISHIFRLETILNSICHDIESLLDFDFAAVQLIRPEGQIIETVYGTGIAANWAGRAKHYLEPDPELRDIQADIAMTGHVEIIAGWDKRFDRWIYEEHNHKQLVRIFVPIIVCHNESGNILHDWPKQCQWKVLTNKKNRGDQHSVIKIMPLHQDRVNMKIIGTIEAGYCNREANIGIKQAIILTKLVAQRAADVYQALLPHVLEIIVEHAMRIIQADSASLHFLYDKHQRRYIYEACAGNITKQFLETYPPRDHGLGWQTIEDQEPKFIPDLSKHHHDLELRRLNPKIFKEGIKAIASFPLLIDEKKGVLYVHFRSQHRFAVDEIRWVQLFANHAIDAIRHATLYLQMRDRARQLATLRTVAESLASTPKESDLLRHIAWDALNILAADVVTIYEYMESESRFLIPPDIAGRLKVAQAMATEIGKYDTPAMVVKSKRNIYANRSVENRILNSLKSKQSTSKTPFVIREKIESSAAILLKANAETVGVMFINYRRFHHFSDEEQRMIDTLASSVAIAIKNRRMLDTLSAIDREIVATLNLEQLLNLIVKRAVDLTRADVGDIRRLNPFNQELVVQTRYPSTSLVDPALTRIKVGHGVTGWVATHHQSALINDVHSDKRYKAYFPDVGSELCVPLLDKTGHILGVLNVETHRIGAFNRSHQWMLESLANQAVIAIQNAESQKQLIAAETMATLGDLAGPLVHKMKNDIGAIRTLAQDIWKTSNMSEDTKHALFDIQFLADQVLQEARDLNRWILLNPQPVDIRETIHSALNRVAIPSSITKNISLPSNLPRASGAEQQLTDVFINLLQNAIEAMPTGGILSIKAKNIELESKQWLVVEVLDTGKGIPEEDLEKIFQRNYSTKDTKKNLGFGLWWTRLYIERLGGQLTVESWPRKKTLFTVTLRCYKP